ncbi:MAG: bifunctional diaminohydroxyphosphoribosylaminopyrimidine deaminase/5-amino-6-(5-phosphoribosylamino)uracil reductase RibD [Phycisphaerales bacterium]|nr:bifunctional diaminohydroxyphosphoribosylaminopyrimidine deaminase/5-amino-6-(5-phosphoribosylamino)uracil reductase RibD [Phycisphaerales bacterium]
MTREAAPLRGDQLDIAMLDRAARVAWRGAGCVEPNPMVGCVIGRADGTVLATAHHERFGGLHAEAAALGRCTAQGADVRGATAWVTLEPCNHVGKTPACSAALMAAGVGRVVYATADPNPCARGGAAMLRTAGVRVERCAGSALANAVSMPFVKRITTGLPWVIAKWAQTEAGFVSFEGGEPRWVTGERSRRDVHRLRGRVDAIVTGIGTVLADDPLLTVRGVPARRAPIRVVLDRKLRMPIDCNLVRTAAEAPTIVITAAQCALSDHARALKTAGVDVVAGGAGDGPGDLRSLFATLVDRFDVATVLVESGPRVLGACAEAGLIDEAWVYVAKTPMDARGALRIDQGMLSAAGLGLVRESTLGADVRRIYWRGKYVVTSGGSGC